MNLLNFRVYLFFIIMFSCKHDKDHQSHYDYPPLEVLGVAKNSWDRTGTRFENNATISSYTTNIDDLVDWLFNCEAFEYHKQNNSKNTSELKKEILSHLNFDNSCLLIEHEKNIAGKTYFIEVRCKYAKSKKCLKEIIVEIRLALM